MELVFYVAILRRRWAIVAGVTLLTLLVSLVVAFRQPARYGVTVSLLVTRSNLGDRRLASPINLDAEDRVAYDLPSIVGSPMFARDVVAELGRRGRPLGLAAVEAALHAENDRQLLHVVVTTPDPGDAPVIADVAVALIRRNGLRYWGDVRATPEDPGLNVAVLDLPTEAVLVGGVRAMVGEVVLRGVLGLMAGVGLVFVLHYVEFVRVHGRWPDGVVGDG